MIGIVISRPDEASRRIGEHLRSLADWSSVDDGALRAGDFELREFDDWHLELDGVAEEFTDPDLIVFASRHSGDSGRLLSAHFTGNFGEAEHGGTARDLATPAPWAHKRVIGSLRTHAPDGWDVAMECTHHGPTTVGAPSMYVELGSNEAQWQSDAGAEAVAKSILELGDGDALASTADRNRVVVGFGGNHYAPRPTRLLAETDVAFGHVAADWSLEELGTPSTHRELVRDMFEKSGAECAIFDGPHPEVRTLIEDLGYRVVSETWIRETVGRPMDLVATVEDELSTVDHGLRFGRDATGSSASLSVDSLPDDLLAECETIDADATHAAVHDHAVAFETEENGNLIRGEAAFDDETDKESLIEALTSILREDYRTVRREEDAVLAVRESFDPAAARDAGVPEGPKFGQLAAGKPVEVDGTVVSPESVRTREKRRFNV